MVAWLALVFAPAEAQPLPLELPGMPASRPGTRDVRSVTADTTSFRFDGETVPGPTYTAGEQVDVIVVDGDRARIRKDDRYGWVPVSVLAAPAPTTMPMGTPPSNLLQLPPLLSPPK